MTQYVEPVPGGTVGRTDQGVDISGPPRTPILAIAKETLAGIIQNWYNGQPYYYFKQAGSNVYNYVAEQITSNLRVGQTVRAGQQIGQIAPSGTGLELGFATPSGATLARATTGYTEGQVTPAGSAYRAQVLGRGRVATGGSSVTSGDNLGQLWIQAGGDPRLANTMAAVAMAESSGQTGAVHKNNDGSIDRGLWQINSVHSQFDAQRLVSDPLYNAQAAVSIEKSQGLTAWTTYSSGAYRQFLGSGSKFTPNYGGANGGITRPGGDSPSGPTPSDELQKYLSLRDMPRTAPPQTKNPFSWWAASFTGNWNNLGGGV